MTDPFRQMVVNEMWPALEDTFSEPLEFLPMVRPPNQMEKPDPSRRPFTGCGIFRSASYTARVMPTDNLKLQPITILADPTVVIAARNLAWRPRVADHIVRANGERYGITSVDFDGIGSSVTLGLTMMGRHRQPELIDEPCPEPETTAPPVNVNAPKPAVKKVVARKKNPENC